MDCLVFIRSVQVGDIHSDKNDGCEPIVTMSRSGITVFNRGAIQMSQSQGSKGSGAQSQS